MNDEQLKELIERVCSEYHGQLDHLYQAVGLLVVGQLYGWRVMRLISTAPIGGKHPHSLAISRH